MPRTLRFFRDHDFHILRGHTKSGDNSAINTLEVSERAAHKQADAAGKCLFLLLFFIAVARWHGIRGCVSLLIQAIEPIYYY